jgi:hypothetical protein
LLGYAVGAERVGLDSVTVSDHFQPWEHEGGHAPFSLSWLEHLAESREVKVVTGIDDYSQFVVCARLVLRATARPACQALSEALARHGVPEQILTENVPRNIFRLLCPPSLCGARSVVPSRSLVRLGVGDRCRLVPAA